MKSIEELKQQLRDIEVSKLESLGLSHKDAEFAVDGIDCDIDIKDVLDCIDYNEEVKRFLIEKKIANKKEKIICDIQIKKRADIINDVLSKMRESVLNHYNFDKEKE